MNYIQCVWLVALLCMILCNPVDCSLPVSSVHGIFQARILVRVAISYSGDLPDPGIKSSSPALAGKSSATSATWKPNYIQYPVTNHDGKEYEKECICSHMYMHN